MYLYTYINIYIYTYIYIYIYTHVCIRIYLYIYTYVHMHIVIRSLSCYVSAMTPYTIYIYQVFVLLFVCSVLTPYTICVIHTIWNPTKSSGQVSRLMTQELKSTPAKSSLLLCLYLASLVSPTFTLCMYIYISICKIYVRLCQRLL